jgi:23S rRNA (uridine2552-2'-O)-methyltransferase
VGVDIERPVSLSAPNFCFIQGDILELDSEWLVKEIGPRDLVISDMAPRTTGIKIADASRSMELADRALEIALFVLKNEGHLLCKVFQGEDQNRLKKRFGDFFDQMRLIRPLAVRKQSKEVYVLGSGFSRRRHGYGGQEGSGGKNL